MSLSLGLLCRLMFLHGFIELDLKTRGFRGRVRLKNADKKNPGAEPVKKEEETTE